MNAARLRLEWAILLLLAMAGALAAQSSGFTQRLDNQLLDLGTVLSRPAMDRDIVIVAIDDASLEQIGPWPWPRDVHARLVDQLDAAGARLIVLDILFPDPGTPEGDAALAQAIERSGKVLLPHSFIPRRNAREGIDPLWPLPELRGASAGVGHVVAQPDADGVMRRFDLALATDRDSYPHLAIKALDALGGDVQPLLAHRGASGDKAIVPFHPQSVIPHQPASEVLAGSTLPGFFDGKIVLIGATAQGMGDRYSVAAGPVELMSGIATQANLLSALRQDALIVPLGLMVQGIVAVGMIAGLFMAFWYLPPRYVLVCAVGVVVAMLLASMLLLAGARMWLAPGSIIVTAILAYPLWSWRRLSHVSRYLEREAMRLRADDPAVPAGEGLDYVTAQVERLRGLISTVRGSLAFLGQVIEAAPDAIVVLDRSGVVQMLNDRAAALFPESRGQSDLTFAELLIFARAKQDRSGSELTTTDGKTYLIARAPIAEVDAGEPTGEIIALRDVSEIRRLDDERNQLLEFLSHDMRTPQVAIVGLTEQADGSGASRDIVARIRAQAMRTLKLADDFVQLARMEHASLAIADTDIAALIEEACDRAYAPALAKRITIAQDLPEAPCFANVDASLIARMLDNLIGNAIKFSGEGSRVSVSLTDFGDGGFSMEIADPGPGLSKARLADPFARFGAHSGHGGTSSGPSSGLGLALVKKVVDSHSGSITLSSSEATGTRFTITLPGRVPDA